MRPEKYIKQQSWRSKPGEYRTVRPRVKDAAGWLINNLPGGIKGKTIMDLGTRDGWALDHYNLSGALSTAGVELVPSVASYARKRGRNVHCGDMQSLPEFIPGGWDIVVALHSLEHTTVPAAAIKEMLRICRNGGWLFIVVPKEQWKPGKDRAHNYFFETMGHLLALLAGFPEIDNGGLITQEKVLISPKGKPNTELRVLARKL